ncbi:hypothetical protein MRX96_059380 [Rhipicephalus microplus]
MGNIFGKLEPPFTTFFVERVHAQSFHDRNAAEHFRLPCSEDVPTATLNNKKCLIKEHLDICNELLFHIGQELREKRGGWLSLVSFDTTGARVAPPANVNLCPTESCLCCLNRTHVCVTNLRLLGEWVTSHSEIIVEELPEKSQQKMVLVRFPSVDTPQTHLVTLLPSCFFLEELTLYYSPNTNAVMKALSEFLIATTCLKSLVLHACHGGQPQKKLAEALAANSTVKTFELWVNWYLQFHPLP